MAERVYRLLFDVKQTNAQGLPQMTEEGKQVIPNSQIQVSSLYKKSLDMFKDEFPDEDIALLHYSHHQ